MKGQGKFSILDPSFFICKSGRNYQLKTQEISIEIITTLVYDKGDL